MSRALGRVLISLALLGALAPTAWALQKTVRSKGHNYEQAPVTIQRSSVTLIETYFTPTQLPISGRRVKQTRVRYANRAGLSPSSFALKEDVMCRNNSRQDVVAMELSIVLLDAFHQPILNAGQAEAVIVQRISTPVPAKSERRVEWEQQVGSLDVYEVAVVMTRVRFADNSLWQAPAEELIDF